VGREEEDVPWTDAALEDDGNLDGKVAVRGRVETDWGGGFVAEDPRDVATRGQQRGAGAEDP
jgi:hypothetical protein